MLQLFLFIFAAAVQAAAPDRQTAVAPDPAPPAVAAPAEAQPAPPAFLAPAAGPVAQAAPAAAPPAFLTPAAPPAAAAPPAFLAPSPQPAAEAPPAFLAPAPNGLQAEPQTPSGRFTTATEIRPIMAATRANWVALRDYDGKDLLYVTQIWSWRCGMARLRIGINGGPLQLWPLPPCHDDTAAPNAITDSDGLPYAEFPAGAVGSIEVEITYDDLTTETAQFSRASVLMP